MATKPQLRSAVVSVCITLMMACAGARGDEVPLVTGKQWTDSTQQMKKAYLVGIENVMQVELAYQAGNAPSDTQSIIPRFARGVKGQTLDSVREGLDRWYAAHPDQLQRPVIETIWFEMVAPALQNPR